MVSSPPTAAVMDTVIAALLFFLGGMIVGSSLVAIAWYIVHIKYYRPKPDVEDKVSESEARVAFAENEVEEIEPDNCPVLVDTTEGKRKWTAPAATEDSDFIIDEKSQILSIVDFKSVPRNEGARQQARRELVIQMLIAESMTN